MNVVVFDSPMRNGGDYNDPYRIVVINGSEMLTTRRKLIFICLKMIWKSCFPDRYVARRRKVDDHV